MDNFEWTSGYTQRFGMNWVNFTDPGRAVYPKNSSKWFGNLATTNHLEPSDNDENYTY